MNQLNDKIICPYCNSKKIMFRGYREKDRNRKRCYCKSCGMWFTYYVNQKGHQSENESIQKEIIEDGNELSASVKMSNFQKEGGNKKLPITTIDELIDYCKVNKKEWKLVKQIINTWGSQKNPNFQIKGWFQKNNLEPINFPPVHPVSYDIAYHKIPQQPKKSFLRWLIIPDSQTGFYRDPQSGKLHPLHDRLAWSIIFQVLERENIDRIILLGDNLDLTDSTDKFAVSEEFRYNTQASLIDLGWCLGQIRLRCPDIPIYYLEGNHEFRLKSMLEKNNGAACNLCRIDNLNQPVMSIPNLLTLEKFNIDYFGPYPAGSISLNDRLSARHGELSRSMSGKSVAAILQNTHESLIVGHGHRLEMASRTYHKNGKQIIYTVAMAGTISKIDGSVPSTSPRINWQQGFPIVDTEDGDGEFTINLFPINNGKSIIYGHLYRGYDYVDNMKRDVDWYGF